MSTARAPSGRALDLAFAAAFAVGLAAWLASFAFGGVLPAWRALLASFLFFTPLAGGMAVWPAAVQASNGRWAGTYENLPATGLGFAPASLLILIALWIAAGSWAPWPGRTFVQGFWLDSNFLFARDAAGLIVFWALAWRYQARRRLGGGRVAGPVLIVAYGLVFSLLGFDLVMALTPDWHSSLFGGYFFASGVYAAVAAWGLMAARLPGPDEERLHDLGKLAVTFCLITTYLLFSQLLPIWYENLPLETGFAATRLNFQPWLGVGVFLVVAVYLGPLVLLLTSKAKRRPGPLGAICGLILFGLWVERWWLVAPSLPGNPLFGLADVGAGLALLGLFGLGIRLFSRRMRPLPPPEGGKP